MIYHLSDLPKHRDTRGDLVAFLKKSELKDERHRFGQIYFVTFNKVNVIRGNHYHKKWNEWFGIISGKILVRLKDITTGEEAELILDSETDKYHRLQIGVNVAHAFKSLTSQASLLNYADGEWSPYDTFPSKLL